MKKIVISLLGLLLGCAMQAETEVAKVVPAVEKPSLNKVIIDITAVIDSVKNAVDTFKNMPAQAQGLMGKMDCVSSGDKACISSFMLNLGDFLNNLNLSLFGKIQGGTMLVKKGPLVNLAGLIQTGYAYNGKKSDSIDKLVANMTTMAARIQGSIEFLQLLGFIIDPMGTISKQSGAQQALIAAEPVKIETKELGELDF